jgi:hypothetical protein
LGGDVFHVSPTLITSFARAHLDLTVSVYAWRPMGTQD